MLRALLLVAPLLCGSAGCGPSDVPRAEPVTSERPPPAPAGPGGQAGALTSVAPATEPGTAPGTEPGTAAGGRPAQLRVSVVQRYPHDPGAFTQGLLLHDGELYESTGLQGASTVRRVELATGRVLASTSQPADVFGEGLALVRDELIQLSWKNGLAFVYDVETLAVQGNHRYSGEGWGLCFDGEVLYQSDGSNRLRRRDPETFAELGTVDVTDGANPVGRLNELECVDGAVYANVWLTDDVVEIDPRSGAVTAWIDASALVPAGAGPDDVLNGIAHDPTDGTFLLTGKRWAELYRVTFTG